VIVNKDYKLDECHYITEVHDKRQIVIGNTSLLNMRHYDLWVRRVNGKFKSVSPYTIGLDGTIYEHYDPKYYSEFLNIESIDKFIIPIVIENEGWLVKNYENNELLSWCGDIYNRGDDIINKKWRAKTMWTPYSDVQLDSLSSLCNSLLSEFGITNFVSDHNTKISDIEENEGIYYRSNYSLNYLDITPAFKINDFKTKIENNENTIKREGNS